ncbi:hypothetical protein ACIBK8_16020 [Streptomyces sp. NPDC050161]|uniref:hypothetical protein n=1 Tax=Streptomyces sp. NPDC050161 TaxID=3365604 RepID=UPI0037B47558
MITFVVALSIALAVGGIAHIVRLFIRDHRIETHGRDIQALVEAVRYLSSNDSGASTIWYRLSWQEDGTTRQVEGRDTIPAFYSSRVQKGCVVTIKYLDDDHLHFDFHT